MKNFLIRYAPLIASSLLCALWLLTSILPTARELAAVSAEEIQLRSEVSTWIWVNDISPPSEDLDEPMQARTISIDDLASSLRGSRLKLLHLSPAQNDGDYGVEITGDFRGILHFLSVIEGRAALVKAIRKSSAGGSLTVSIIVRGES